MIWPVLLVVTSILLAGVGAVGIAALDLSRRPVDVPAPWLAAAASGGALPLVGLALGLGAGSSAALRWQQVVSVGSWAALVTLIGALSAAGIATALALSRGLQPGGPSRWRPLRVAGALAALAVLPVLVAVDWEHGRALAALPFGWLALPVLVFGRSGATRLERGAAVVVVLVWVAGVAWIGGVRLALFDAYLKALLSDGDRPEVVPVLLLEAPALWALGWATAAIGRAPSMRALLVAAPSILATFVLTLVYTAAPDPVVSPAGPIPRTVDLAGRAPERIGPPALCLASPAGPVGDCRQDHPAAIALPPDRPLSEVAAGAWMVLAPPETGLRPSLLRHRVLEVGPFEARLDHRLHFVEVGGRAQVELNGAVVIPPLPVEAGLRRSLEIALPRHGTFVAEVDPSPRWTVQDLVRMCVTVRELVDASCALGPPAGR